LRLRSKLANPVALDAGMRARHWPFLLTMATWGFGGGPPGTRTQNLRIKSPLLYPIELEARSGRLYQTCPRGLKRVTEGT
jgi:hypothetical protein